MFAGQFSIEALKALVSKYGDQIDYIECNGWASILGDQENTKQYCMGRMVRL